MFERLGERLQNAREKAGISQRKLGLMLGLSDKAISSYESGRTLPPLQTLNRIAEELNIPLTSLLFEQDNLHSIESRLKHIEQLLLLITEEFDSIKQAISKNEESSEQTPPSEPIDKIPITQ